MPSKSDDLYNNKERARSELIYAATRLCKMDTMREIANLTYAYFHKEYSEAVKNSEYAETAFQKHMDDSNGV